MTNIMEEMRNIILRYHNDILRHTMSEYGYHTSLSDYLYRAHIFLDYDNDAYKRMRFIVYADSPNPKRVLEKWLGKIEYETRIDVFNEMCREKGGEPEPIPCRWGNTWCDEDEECVYENEPIMYDEEIGMYCCKPVKR